MPHSTPTKQLDMMYNQLCTSSKIVAVPKLQKECNQLQEGANQLQEACNQ